MGWFRDHLDKNQKLATLVVVAAVLALGALFALSWVAGFRGVGKGLVHPHWAWLAVAVAGEVIAYLGYVLAYREVVRAEKGAELQLPHALALVSTGFGVFVAAGGFALDDLALRRAGLTKKEARERVFGLGALEYIVLAPVAAVAAGFLLVHTPGVNRGLTIPWIVGVPAGLAAALLLLLLRGKLPKRGRWRRVLGAPLAALLLIRRMAARPAAFGLAVAGIVFYWLGDIFCLWATLHAFYAKPPPVAQLVLGYATGYALTRRTLPLGGAGVVEALLPFSLGWVGIGLAPAVLAVLAYRVINLWLPIIPALAGLPTLRRLGQGDLRRSRLSRARQQPG